MWKLMVWFRGVHLVDNFDSDWSSATGMVSPHVGRPGDDRLRADFTGANIPSAIIGNGFLSHYKNHGHGALGRCNSARVGVAFIKSAL